MAYGKYGDNHYQCGFGAHDGGDSCQYDTRKEKRKIILRLRVLRHEWSLSSGKAGNFEKIRSER
jgi:hypothetical protein